MNFWDLRCFLATAEELNFTRAAERLHLSQQALSCRISKLESQYQTKLFDRAVPLRLTPAGSHMVHCAKFILASKEQMDQEIFHLRDTGTQLLQIGVLANRTAALLQSALLKQASSASGIEIKITELFEHAFCTALKTNQLKIGIGFQVPSSTLIYEPLLTENYYLLISSSLWHTLFSPQQQQALLQSDSVPLSAFVNCPFIASKQTTWLKETFETSCRMAGTTPHIAAETSSLLTRLTLCAAGIGIMIIPSSLLYTLAASPFSELHHTLIFLKLSDQPQTGYRTIGINYSKECKSDLAIQTILQSIRTEAFSLQYK